MAYNTQNNKGYIMLKNNSIEKLQKLINSSDNSIQSLQSIFYDMAKELMNNYEFSIKNIFFELTEIEFYYFNESKHCDVFTHIHHLQKETNGILYVHESWGNYGGIDITFGNGDFYGGILIRGIKINSNFIAGPSKVRTELINTLKENINTYHELQNFFNEYPLQILKKEPIEYNIYHSTRYNLGKKQDDKFRYALYRFVREDYLYEPKGNTFISRNNVKERSLLKAISSLTLDIKCNEKTTLNKIENNVILKKGIESFKVCT